MIQGRPKANNEQVHLAINNATTGETEVADRFHPEMGLSFSPYYERVRRSENGER